MSKVFFKSVTTYSNTEEINSASKDILNRFIEEEKTAFEKCIPYN